MKGGSHESVFNIALGEVLPYESKYKFTEKRGVLLNKNKQPDILVDHKDYPPVIIESSKSDKDAEKDAITRLGEKTLDGNTIQCIIAVHIPEIFHDKDNKTMRELLKTESLRYCVYKSIDGIKKPKRIPSQGWIEGTAYDISGFIKNASVTNSNSMINDIYSMLEEIAKKLPKSDKLIKELHQRDQQKTANSIVILWLNTLMIQEHLSIYNKNKKFKVSRDDKNNKKITIIDGVITPSDTNTYDIKPLYEPKPGESPDPHYYQSTWNDIHEINWQTIFEKSIESLNECIRLDYTSTSQVFETLHKVIAIVKRHKYKKLVNVGAELFPKMSVDRKTAAAFYTNDTTAEFLANLTINEQDIDKDIFERIKIVDMACGTGTLLRTGYNTIESQYEREYGINNKHLQKIHNNAIKQGLIGTDIFPISTHLTASSLTMMGFGNFYDEMNIGMMPVGKPNKTGSLEFLDNNASYDLMTPNKKIKGIESDSIEYNQIVIKNNSIDYILMNPPYSKTRSNQSVFDIVGLNDKTRKLCQDRWNKLIKNMSDKTIAKMTAGLAASFLILAGKKLKPGGRLGFVLPLSMAFNHSWDVTRDYITRNFEDIIAITMSGGFKTEQLSADTKMNEMLLVATKSEKPHKPYPIKCCTLETGFDHGIATELARSVSNAVEKCNDKTPVYPIMFGEEIGKCMIFKPKNGKDTWTSLGSTNSSLLEFVTNLKSGVLETNKQKYKFSIKLMPEVFSIGPTQHLIGYVNDADYLCGIFEIHPINNDFTDKNASLWHTISNIQYSMLTKPTHKGIDIGKDINEVKKITDQNGVLFYSRGYGWSAQKLLASVTTKSIMGGTSWTSLSHKNRNVLKSACLWFNSIFGLLVNWSQTSRTQPGRSRAGGINSIKKIHCPDFNKLSKHKLEQAGKKLDELKNKYLMPGSRMHLDTIRHEIDKAIIDLFDWQISDKELDNLRRMVVNEPSITTFEQTNLDDDEYITDSVCQDIILDGVNEPISIIITNKNVIIFNPNMTKLNDQVLKTPYSIIKSVQYSKNTIQLVLYDPPTNKKSIKYWNNNIGQITDLPPNQLEKLYQYINSKLKLITK